VGVVFTWLGCISAVGVSRLCWCGS